MDDSVRLASVTERGQFDRRYRAWLARVLPRHPGRNFRCGDCGHVVCRIVARATRRPGDTHPLRSPECCLAARRSDCASTGVFVVEAANLTRAGIGKNIEFDVVDVALGHTAKMRWNPREKWVQSRE